MATREKKKVLLNINEAHYQEQLAEYAKSEAAIRKINADIDLQTQKLREKHQHSLNSWIGIKESSFDVVMQYAEENPQLFEKKRSIETPFGVIGFRLGTPKLLNRKGYQIKAVIELIKDKFPKFIKTTEAINKEAILADKDMTDNDIKSIGMEKVQEDSFYIDLKTENIES